MNKLTNHLSRKELIASVRTGGKLYKLHLQQCNWCNLYFELLKNYDLIGKIILPPAPGPWIEKAASLAKKPERLKALKIFLAQLIFDSWAIPQPRGIRSLGAALERRIKFESGSTSLDLRVEKRKDHWDFTARVIDDMGQNLSGKIILGKDEVLPDENGFYQWSSSQPPKALKLRLGEKEITFPEILWKKVQPE